MIRFIDDHRDVYGVESICAVVPVAPSTYYLHKARVDDPTQRSARAQQDDRWRTEIQRVFDANHQVYGPSKVGVSCAGKTMTWRATRPSD